AGATVAPQRHHLAQRIREFAYLRVHIRCGRPDLNVVDRDATRTEFTSQPAGETGDRGLRHRIDRHARTGHPVGVDAADVDDAAGSAQMWESALDRDE